MSGRGAGSRRLRLPGWLSRGRLGRLVRYSLSSVVAASISAVTFAVAYDAGLGTTSATLLAFVAGMLPSWVLNRWWAWSRNGRPRFGREVVLYVAAAVTSLAASAASTHWVSGWAPQVTRDHVSQVALVAAAYVVTYGVLWAAKFALYETVVFRPRPEDRSRHHVRTTTAPNRQP